MNFKQDVEIPFAVRRLVSITHLLRIVKNACPLENQILGCWLLEKCQLLVGCIHLESQGTGGEDRGI
jgi:hypothetical protein